MALHPGRRIQKKSEIVTKLTKTPMTSSQCFPFLVFLSLALLPIGRFLYKGGRQARFIIILKTEAFLVIICQLVLMVAVVAWNILG